MGGAKVAPTPQHGNASKYETNVKEQITPDDPDATEGEEGEAKKVGVEEEPINVGSQCWNPKRKVINPFSEWMSRWDQAIISALIWTALVTPFEVSFLNPDWNWLFVVNRLIDCIFLTDMGFTFFLDPMDDQTRKINGIPNHRLMAEAYLSGWFTIDFLSCVPFDLVTILLEGGDFQNLKFLRALRLLRLVKLLRLFRASRIFARWEDRVAVDYAMVSLLKSTLGTLLVSHWIGCLWYITAYIEDADVNWVKSNTVDGFDSLESEGVTLFDKYIISWYFSVMTMSTIGYGDMNAVTTTERIVCCFMMLLGAGVYAYVVGNITSTVASMEAGSRRYQELMDMLNQFLEMNEITDDLRIESRAYMRTRQAAGNLTDWNDLLNEMSPDLREKVAEETHPGWALACPFFSNACVSFQAKAASQFTEITFPRGEMIVEMGQPVDSLFLIKKGMVCCKGKVIQRGGVFGADVVLNLKDSERRANYVAQAWTFTIVEALAVEALMELLDDFPEVKENCRKMMLWQITRENCWAYASAVLQIQGKRRLYSATDNELVDFYKWKVKWLRLEGMTAVKTFRAIIKIQKTIRGMITRKRLNKSKEQGVGAIEVAIKNALGLGMRKLEEKIGTIGENAEDDATLGLICGELARLSQALDKLEAKPPALPIK